MQSNQRSTKPTKLQQALFTLIWTHVLRLFPNTIHLKWNYHLNHPRFRLAILIFQLPFYILTVSLQLIQSLLNHKLQQNAKLGERHTPFSKHTPAKSQAVGVPVQEKLIELHPGSREAPSDPPLHLEAFMRFFACRREEGGTSRKQLSLTKDPSKLGVGQLDYGVCSCFSNSRLLHQALHPRSSLSAYSLSPSMRTFPMKKLPSFQVSSQVYICARSQMTFQREMCGPPPFMLRLYPWQACSSLTLSPLGKLPAALIAQHFCWCTEETQWLEGT